MSNTTNKNNSKGDEEKEEEEYFEMQMTLLRCLQAGQLPQALQAAALIQEKHPSRVGPGSPAAALLAMRPQIEEAAARAGSGPGDDDDDGDDNNDTGSSSSDESEQESEESEESASAASTTSSEEEEEEAEIETQEALEGRLGHVVELMRARTAQRLASTATAAAAERRNTAPAPTPSGVGAGAATTAVKGSSTSAKAQKEGGKVVKGAKGAQQSTSAPGAAAAKRGVSNGKAAKRSSSSSQHQQGVGRKGAASTGGNGSGDDDTDVGSGEDEGEEMTEEEKALMAQIDAEVGREMQKLAKVRKHRSVPAEATATVCAGTLFRTTRVCLRKKHAGNSSNNNRKSAGVREAQARAAVGNVVKTAATTPIKTPEHRAAAARNDELCLPLAGPSPFVGRGESSSSPSPLRLHPDALQCVVRRLLLHHLLLDSQLSVASPPSSSSASLNEVGSDGAQDVVNMQGPFTPEELVARVLQSVEQAAGSSSNNGGGSNDKSNDSAICGSSPQWSWREHAEDARAAAYLGAWASFSVRVFESSSQQRAAFAERLRRERTTSGREPGAAAGKHKSSCVKEDEKGLEESPSSSQSSGDRVDAEMKFYYDAGKLFSTFFHNSVVALVCDSSESMRREEEGGKGKGSQLLSNDSCLDSDANSVSSKAVKRAKTGHAAPLSLALRPSRVLEWMCHAILLADPHMRVSPLSGCVCYPTLPSLLVASMPPEVETFAATRRPAAPSSSVLFPSSSSSSSSTAAASARHQRGGGGPWEDLAWSTAGGRNEAEAPRRRQHPYLLQALLATLPPPPTALAAASTAPSTGVEMSMAERRLRDWMALCEDGRRGTADSLGVSPRVLEATEGSSSTASDGGGGGNNGPVGHDDARHETPLVNSGSEDASAADYNNSPFARCAGFQEGNRGNSLLRYWNREARETSGVSARQGETEAPNQRCRKSGSDSGGGGGSSEATLALVEDEIASGGGGSGGGSAVLLSLALALAAGESAGAVGPAQAAAEAAAAHQGPAGSIIVIHVHVMAPLFRAVFHRDAPYPSPLPGGSSAAANTSVSGKRSAAAAAAAEGNGGAGRGVTALVGVPITLTRFAMLTRWHASRTAFAHSVFQHSFLYFVLLWAANPVLARRQRFEWRQTLAEMRLARSLVSASVTSSFPSSASPSPSPAKFQATRLSVIQRLSSQGLISADDALRAAAAVKKAAADTPSSESDAASSLATPPHTNTAPLFRSQVSGQAEEEAMKHNNTQWERQSEQLMQQQPPPPPLPPHELHRLSPLRVPVEPPVTRLLLFRLLRTPGSERRQQSLSSRQARRNANMNASLETTAAARVNNEVPLRFVELLPTDEWAPQEVMRYLWETRADRVEGGGGAGEEEEEEETAAGAQITRNGEETRESSGGDDVDDKSALFSLNREERRLVAIPLAPLALEAHLSALFASRRRHNMVKRGNTCTTGAAASGRAHTTPARAKNKGSRNDKSCARDDDSKTKGSTSSRPVVVQMTLREAAVRLLWAHEYGVAAACEMLWAYLRVYGSDGGPGPRRVRLLPPVTAANLSAPSPASEFASVTEDWLVEMDASGV